MGNAAGEQGLALQQHFPYKFPYSFKTSDCHKISSFNDGGLKFGHFDILDMFFFISGICEAHNFMKRRSRDGLAAKGLFPRVTVIYKFECIKRASTHSGSFSFLNFGEDEVHCVYSLVFNVSPGR